MKSDSMKKLNSDPLTWKYRSSTVVMSTPSGKHCRGNTTVTNTKHIVEQLEQNTFLLRILWVVKEM